MESAEECTGDAVYTGDVCKWEDNKCVYSGSPCDAKTTKSTCETEKDGGLFCLWTGTEAEGNCGKRTSATACSQIATDEGSKCTQSTITGECVWSTTTNPASCIPKPLPSPCATGSSSNCSTIVGNNHLFCVWTSASTSCGETSGNPTTCSQIGANTNKLCTDFQENKVNCTWSDGASGKPGTCALPTTDDNGAFSIVIPSFLVLVAVVLNLHLVIDFFSF